MIQEQYSATEDGGWFVRVHECVFMTMFLCSLRLICACVSVCSYRCATTDTLACLGKRLDVRPVHLWDGGGAKDAGKCPARGDPLVC